MKTITVRREIEAPVQRVWDVLTDLDNAPANLTGIVQVERVAGDTYAVGTRWRETRKVFGKEATEEMTVAEVEPLQRTVILAESGGMRYRSEFTLAPTPTGTALTMTFGGDSDATGLRALLEKMMSLVGITITRRMMTADLTDIARAAEGR
ncbi:SRPBCC family protein [Nocardia sp. NPDC050378]|uniref:SRPBCC family protein n=1 Tax=Nocardia sp. NPDC050378 TaxID=3155400 RepID=UPI0033C49DEB